MSYFPEAYGAKISDSDIGRLRSVLTAVEPVAEAAPASGKGKAAPSLAPVAADEPSLPKAAGA